MSHPRNRRERFLTGFHKGKRRAEGMCFGWWLNDKDAEKRRAEWMERNSCRMRDTTKFCNCMMCANPRKVFGEKTLQEKRHEDDGREDCSYQS